MALLEALRSAYGDAGFALFESPSFGLVVGVDPVERHVMRSHEDLMRLARRRQELTRPAPRATFNGGFIGALGHDYVRHLEPRLKRGGYFAALEGLEGVVDGEFRLFLDGFTLDASGAPKFFAESKRGAANRRQLEEILAAHALLEPVTESRGEAVEISTAALRAHLGAEKFAAHVAQVREHIAAGDIFQAVISEAFEMEGAPDSLRLLHALYEVSDVPYRFHLTMADGSRFLGASPEMLVRCLGQDLETHPIAGTRPAGPTEADTERHARRLLSSEKERAEHLMLVDLARNDLGRVSMAGSVAVPEFMALKRFSNIQHLVSRVTGRLLDGLDPLEALAASFPAGTLTGAPKIRALEIISALEDLPRGPYGGTVAAYSLGGDLDSCIAIRSVRVQEGRAYLRAGAGIVADSIAEQEYLEVHNKLRSLRRALALAGAARPTAGAA